MNAKMTEKEKELILGQLELFKLAVINDTLISVEQIISRESNKLIIEAYIL